ncbi:MAG: DUF3592 domain-containing protein [Pseudomonadota bacterium]
MGGSVLLTAFFTLFLVIGLAILGFGLRSLHLSNEASSWPTIPGRIISSDFDVNSDSDGTTYRARVKYVYTPMNAELTGERIAFGYSGSSGEKFHRAIHDALPVGAQVAVRYDMANPEQSVLSFGANRSIMFLLLFGAVWTTFTVGMAAMFWFSERGGNKILENMIVYSSG